MPHRLRDSPVDSVSPSNIQISEGSNFKLGKEVLFVRSRIEVGIVGRRPDGIRVIPNIHNLRP